MNKQQVVHGFLKTLTNDEKYPATHIQSANLLFKFLDAIDGVTITEDEEVSKIRLLIPDAEMQKDDKDALAKIEIRLGNKIVPVRKMYLTTGSNSNPELQLNFAPEYFVLEFKSEEEEND